MNAAERLLERLERVRETGSETWVACCPAHDDKSPSLSIKHADERVLVHCFAGCAVEDILAAVGLRLADLFDKPLERHLPPLKRRQRRRLDQALDALRALRVETMIVVLAADRMASRYALSPADQDRLHQAHQRIMAAHDVVIDRPDYKPGHGNRSYLARTTAELEQADAAAARLGGAA